MELLTAAKLASLSKTISGAGNGSVRITLSNGGVIDGVITDQDGVFEVKVLPPPAKGSPTKLVNPDHIVLIEGT
jgi:RNase adaptor protein for sRNA GlmZ degradation